MKSCFVKRLSGTKVAIADLTDYYGLGMIITRINVPKEFRGQGHASDLLAQIQAEARENCEDLYLEIAPSDGLSYEQLLKWYERHGFTYWKGIWKWQYDRI